jgi:hypothetical protein
MGLTIVQKKEIEVSRRKEERTGEGRNVKVEEEREEEKQRNNKERQ